MASQAIYTCKYMCVDGFYIVCFNWCTVTDKKGLMLPGKMTMKYLDRSVEALYIVCDVFCWLPSSSRTLVMMKVNKNPPQGSLETGTVTLAA